MTIRNWQDATLVVPSKNVELPDITGLTSFSHSTCTQ